METVGSYRLGAMIGQGGTATIHLATCLHDGGLVAVKVMRSDLLDEPEFSRRFGVEARLMLSLQHPNILRIRAAGLDDAVPWYAMDYHRRGSLAEVIYREPLSVSAAVGYAMELAEGLGYAHEHGVVHRDVKPGNVLVDDDDVAVLGDFGIARDPDDRRTRVGMMMGTPAFCAPEQLEDPAGADPRSDVYGLGTTLYAILTRQSPAPLMFAHRRDDALAELPASVAPVVRRATMPEVDDRYQSAIQLALALADVATDLG